MHGWIIVEKLGWPLRTVDRWGSTEMKAQRRNGNGPEFNIQRSMLSVTRHSVTWCNGMSKIRIFFGHFQGGRSYKCKWDGKSGLGPSIRSCKAHMCLSRQDGARFELEAQRQPLGHVCRYIDPNLADRFGPNFLDLEATSNFHQDEVSVQYFLKQTTKYRI